MEGVDGRSVCAHMCVMHVEVGGWMECMYMYVCGVCVHMCVGVCRGGWVGGMGVHVCVCSMCVQYVEEGGWVGAVRGCLFVFRPPRLLK